MCHAAKFRRADMLVESRMPQSRICLLMFVLLAGCFLTATAGAGEPSSPAAQAPGSGQPPIAVPPAPKVDGTKPRESDARAETSFTNLINTLITFAAVMAVLAVGTEKLTDFMKKWKRWSKPATLDDTWGMTPEKILVEPDQGRLEVILDSLRNAADRLATDLGIKSSNPPPIPATPPSNLQELKKAIIALHVWAAEIEADRVIALRRWSVVFGVLLAAILGVDALSILRGQSQSWLLGAPDGYWAKTAGIFLSGFGASAGSPFWHDFFDKLTSWKQKRV